MRALSMPSVAEARVGEHRGLLLADPDDERRPARSRGRASGRSRRRRASWPPAGVAPSRRTGRARPPRQGRRAPRWHARTMRWLATDTRIDTSRIHEHLRAGRRPAGDDRVLRPRGPRRRTCRATSSASRRSSTCAATARRASARTSSTTPSTTRSPRRRARRCRSPATGRCARSPSTSRRSTSSPRSPQRDVSRLYRTWAYESAALDLALRQAGQPLHAVLGREPRPLTFVVSLRLGEPPTLEPITQPPGALPDAALQARPDARRGTPSSSPSSSRRARSTRWTSRASTRARSSTTPPTPSFYVRVDRRLPRRVDRGSQAHAGDRRAARAAPRPHHVGREHPLDRRHRGAAVRAADGEPQAVAPGRRRSRCSTPTTTRPSAASAPTAAASSSSASGAGRSSTSPRSSIPTRRTTRRRRAFTSPTRRPACRRARCRRRRRRPAFAGAERARNARSPAQGRASAWSGSAPQTRPAGESLQAAPP